MVGREAGGGSLVRDSPRAKQRAAASSGARRRRRGLDARERGARGGARARLAFRVWNQVWERQRFAATGHLSFLTIESQLREGFALKNSSAGEDGDGFDVGGLGEEVEEVEFGEGVAGGPARVVRVCRSEGRVSGEQET